LSAARAKSAGSLPFLTSSAGEKPRKLPISRMQHCKIRMRETIWAILRLLSAANRWAISAVIISILFDFSNLETYCSNKSGYFLVLDKYVMIKGTNSRAVLMPHYGMIHPAT
jgi:hypothetical protein